MHRMPQRDDHDGGREHGFAVLGLSSRDVSAGGGVRLVRWGHVLEPRGHGVRGLRWRLVLTGECDGLHPVWGWELQRAGGEHAVHGLLGRLLHGLRRVHGVQGVH